MSEVPMRVRGPVAGIVLGFVLAGLVSAPVIGQGTGSEPARMPDAARYGLPSDTLVLRTLQGHVSSALYVTQVSLLGRRQYQRSGFVGDMRLLIATPGAGKGIIVNLPASANVGYEPRISLYDFTGDGLPDALITAQTGGSGGVVNGLIYSFRGRRPALILNSATGIPPGFSGRLVEGYRARLDIPSVARSVYIDLRDRRQYYDELGVYGNGRLLKQTNVWGENAPQIIEAVGPDRNGVYGLRTTEQARGVADVDRIATIVSTLRWERGHWRVLKVQITGVSGAVTPIIPETHRHRPRRWPVYR